MKIKRCTLCYCTDVTCKAIVKPNSVNEFVDYSTDQDDIQNENYCNRCQTHVSLEEVEQEESDQLQSPPEIVCDVDAKKPLSIFTNDAAGQWVWIADYSDPIEYTQLDELFRYLYGDMDKEDLPTDLVNMSDDDLKGIYDSRFQIMFGKALQAIGEAIESKAIEIVSHFQKK